MDTLIVKIETRFGDSKHIELLNGKLFGAYNLKFSEKKLKSLPFFQSKKTGKWVEKCIYWQRKILTPKGSWIYCQ